MASRPPFLALFYIGRAPLARMKEWLYCVRGKKCDGWSPVRAPCTHGRRYFPRIPAKAGTPAALAARGGNWAAKSPPSQIFSPRGGTRLFKRLPRIYPGGIRRSSGPAGIHEVAQSSRRFLPPHAPPLFSTKGSGHVSPHPVLCRCPWSSVGACLHGSIAATIPRQSCRAANGAGQEAACWFRSARANFNCRPI